MCKKYLRINSITRPVHRIFHRVVKCTEEGGGVGGGGSNFVYYRCLIRCKMVPYFAIISICMVTVIVETSVIGNTILFPGKR